MNFEDEPYVRVYKRKTVTAKLIGWEGRMVLRSLLLEVDRAGALDLEGMDPAEALAALDEMPIEHVRTGMARLLERGVVMVSDGVLFLPRFLEAQEARQSDAQRQRESRGKRAAALKVSEHGIRALAQLPPADDQEPAQPVTKRDHIESQDVTDCHDESHVVTNGHSSSAQLSSAQLDPPNPQGGPREDSDSVFTEKVFDFWRKVHGHPKAKLDRKRQRRIVARRREGFSGKDLCQAIRGAKLDPHLMGQSKGSDGTVYDGLQTILRDAEQVERLMALVGASRSIGEPDAESARLRAARDARTESEARAHQQTLAATLAGSTGAPALGTMDTRQLTGGIGG